MAAGRRRTSSVVYLLFLLPVAWAAQECASASCPAPPALKETSVEREEEEISELMRVELIQHRLAKRADAIQAEWLRRAVEGSDVEAAHSLTVDAIQAGWLRRAVEGSDVEAAQSLTSTSTEDCEDNASMTRKEAGATCEDVKSIPADKRGKYCELLTELGAPAEVQYMIQKNCAKTCNTCDGIPSFDPAPAPTKKTKTQKGKKERKGKNTNGKKNKKQKETDCEDNASMTRKEAGATCKDVKSIPADKRGKYCELLTELGAPAEIQYMIQKNCAKTCNTCDGIPSAALAKPSSSAPAPSTEGCTDDPSYKDSSGITCDMLTHIPTSQRGEHCESLTSMGLSAATQKVIRDKCAKVCKTCEVAPTPVPTHSPKMQAILTIKKTCTNLACGKKCLFDEQCAGHKELAEQGVNPNPIYCCPNTKACLDYRLKEEPEKCPMASDVGYRKCDRPGCSQRHEPESYPYSCEEQCPEWDFLKWSDC